jgi:transposase InsO family protein
VANKAKKRRRGIRRIVLGIVDHSLRLNIVLRRLRRVDTWTLLGALFLDFGEHGEPRVLCLDNHPAQRAKCLKSILRRLKIRLRFRPLASSLGKTTASNVFGTLKAHLRDFAIRGLSHLAQSLGQFRFWYNEVRPRQHLGGRTPAQVRHGIDPYRTPPRRVWWYESWQGRLRGWLLRH